MSVTFPAKVSQMINMVLRFNRKFIIRRIKEGKGRNAFHTEKDSFGFSELSRDIFKYIKNILIQSNRHCLIIINSLFYGL